MIGVVPIGEVDEMVPKVVAANITSHMDVDAMVIAPMKHPAYALDSRKLQYDAGLIIEALGGCADAGYDKVVGEYDSGASGSIAQVVNDGTNQWLIFSNTEA